MQTAFRLYWNQIKLAMKISVLIALTIMLVSKPNACSQPMRGLEPTYAIYPGKQNIWLIRWVDNKPIANIHKTTRPIRANGTVVKTVCKWIVNITSPSNGTIRWTKDAAIVLLIWAIALHAIVYRPMEWKEQWSLWITCFLVRRSRSAKTTWLSLICSINFESLKVHRSTGKLFCFDDVQPAENKLYCFFKAWHSARRNTVHGRSQHGHTMPHHIQHTIPISVNRHWINFIFKRKYYQLA